MKVGKEYEEEKECDGAEKGEKENDEAKEEVDDSGSLRDHVGMELCPVPQTAAPPLCLCTPGGLS